MAFVTVRDHRLEYELVGRADAPAPVVVFLHEGLGSLAMWKDFPRRIADAAGCRALVYSRYGYGRSDPLAAPRGIDFMHEEALDVLPELLEKLHIDRPVLFGHSDGASIALIHAGGAPRPPAGVIVMAPHVMVEDISIRSIAAARDAYRTTDLPKKLGRYHAHVDSAFWGWNDVWLDPAFRDWNIEEFLPRIACPLLAIQGENDEYGTMEQLERIVRAVPAAETLKLAGCAHSPHRDQPDVVLDAAVRFIGRVRPETAQEARARENG